MRSWFAAVAAGMLATSGCGADDGPRDHRGREVPASDEVETGIRREIFVVPGVVPPANPFTGTATPPELNGTRIVRYRQAVDPPAPARAILVASPGFLSGAGAWDALARHVVRGSIAAGAPVEMWIVDRRANLLEDTRGVDTAEAAGDPEIGAGYYFGVDTIDGERFPGLQPPWETTYMSEWGLATHVGDLAAVIARVPQADRRGRVFLVGHSLGAFLTEAYAGWRFEDGTQGVDQLAGLILIEGLLRPEPLDEQAYLAGSGSGFEVLRGLIAIREASESYFVLPLLSNDLMILAEVLGLRAALDPSGVIADPYRDDALRILMLLGSRLPPPMTNQAALGFAFDEGSAAIALPAVTCGRPGVGPLEEYSSAFAPDAVLLRPADDQATYSWLAPGPAEPGEFTQPDSLARSTFAGRSNMFEWYFPSRLPLDLAAVGGGAVAEDGYQAAAGLRVFDGPLIDAPILAVSARSYPPERWAPLTGRVAPTIGEGRPHAGATRDQEVAYRLVVADGFTHVDPIMAAERADNPVPAAIGAFVAEHTAAGGVVVPVQP